MNRRRLLQISIVGALSAQGSLPLLAATKKNGKRAHTGYGSVPTHYLVDEAGRVQLITMQSVNWALAELT